MSRTNFYGPKNVRANGSTVHAFLMEIPLLKLFLFPSEKGSILEGKNCLLLGKFFPFRLDHLRGEFREEQQ